MKLESKILQDGVDALLARKGYAHLKARYRGKLLTLESTDKDGNTYPHVRFRRKSVHRWYLEMPVKTKWEMTFFEGTIEELITMLSQQFEWILTIT